MVLCFCKTRLAETCDDHWWRTRCLWGSVLSSWNGVQMKSKAAKTIRFIRFIQPNINYTTATCNRLPILIRTRSRTNHMHVWFSSKLRSDHVTVGGEGKTAPSRGASSIFHWAKTEGEKAESGGVVPREGAATPPHLLGGLGSAVRSPSGARGGAPTAKRFPLFSALRSLFWHDNNVNCGLQPPLAARAPVPPPPLRMLVAPSVHGDVSLMMMTAIWNMSVAGWRTQYSWRCSSMVHAVYT